MLIAPYTPDIEVVPTQLRVIADNAVVEYRHRNGPSWEFTIYEPDHDRAENICVALCKQMIADRLVTHNQIMKTIDFELVTTGNLLYIYRWWYK